MKSKSISFHVEKEDRVGFVIPTHFGGLPFIVAQFILSLRLTGYIGQYTYLVATYGKMCGQVHYQLNKLLKKQGIILNGMFCIKMVDTWTPVFDLSNQQKITNKTHHALPYIHEAVSLVRRNTCGNFMKGTYPRLLAAFYYKIYSIRRRTHYFHVLNSCTGCGLCAKLCPMNTIEIENKRPRWKLEKCTLCLGCLHQCPHFSIQYGKRTFRHGQYVNPYVKHLMKTTKL